MRPIEEQVSRRAHSSSSRSGSDHPTGDESADPVASRHGQQQMRRVVRIMVDGDPRT
jgi:hypothetical protein